MPLHFYNFTLTFYAEYSEFTIIVGYMDCLDYTSQRGVFSPITKLPQVSRLHHTPQPISFDLLTSNYSQINAPSLFWPSNFMFSISLPEKVLLFRDLSAAMFETQTEFVSHLYVLPFWLPESTSHQTPVETRNVLDLIWTWESIIFDKAILATCRVLGCK